MGGLEQLRLDSAAASEALRQGMHELEGQLSRHVAELPAVPPGAVGAGFAGYGERLNQALLSLHEAAAGHLRQAMRAVEQAQGHVSAAQAADLEGSSLFGSSQAQGGK